MPDGYNEPKGAPDKVLMLLTRYNMDAGYHPHEKPFTDEEWAELTGLVLRRNSEQQREQQ